MTTQSDTETDVEYLSEVTVFELVGSMCIAWGLVLLAIDVLMWILLREYFLVYWLTAVIIGYALLVIGDKTVEE